MKTVYLAGPIAGHTRAGATSWRDDMSARLAKHGIRGISPLRCEPIVGERYGLTYDDPRFGTARAIYSKNRMDVRMCDMVLCYFPRELVKTRPSYGTLGELFWADAWDKPVAVVSDYAPLREHPVVSQAASWLLEDLDQAEELIVGVLADYARRVPSELAQ